MTAALSCTVFIPLYVFDVLKKMSQGFISSFDSIIQISLICAFSITKAGAGACACYQLPPPPLPLLPALLTFSILKLYLDLILHASRTVGLQAATQLNLITTKTYYLSFFLCFCLFVLSLRREQHAECDDGGEKKKTQNEGKMPPCYSWCSLHHAARTSGIH